MSVILDRQILVGDMLLDICDEGRFGNQVAARRRG
jgi:hypothetical protein